MQRPRKKKQTNRKPTETVPPPLPMTEKLRRLELADKTVVALTSFYVTARVAENEAKLPPPWINPLSVFFSVRDPNIDIKSYIEHVVRYSKCSRSAFIVALAYMHRLEICVETLSLTVYNLHRLFITAVIVAAKTLDDVCYPNKYYARIGGISDVREVNRLEVLMMKTLSYHLFIDSEEYVSVIQRTAALKMPTWVRAPGFRGRPTSKKQDISKLYARKLRLPNLKPSTITVPSLYCVQNHFGVEATDTVSRECELGEKQGAKHGNEDFCFTALHLRYQIVPISSMLKQFVNGKVIT